MSQIAPGAPPPPTKLDASKPFSEMAERIKRNLPEEFGGAFIIVSPRGDIVSYAAFDPKPDISAFWAMVSASVTTAVAEFEQKERIKDSYRIAR